MSENTPEEWRPVVGYEGLYEVSSHGRVKALPRKRTHYSGAQSQFQGYLKSGVPNKTGHHMTHLTSSASKRSGKLVHRLVAEAFIGPQPEGKPLVLHWDDDPDNNQVTNLRWGTSADNQRDVLRNGRSSRANKTECVNGHAYSDENTYRDPKRGTRQCMTCRRKHGSTKNRARKKDTK